jgi:hypothetical protein
MRPSRSRGFTPAVLTILSALASGAALPLAAQDKPVPVLSDVFGRVVEHESETPLVGATVSLAAGPGGTAGAGTRVTDESGEFRFEGIPAGTYRVVVTLLGYRTLRDTLQVEAETGVEVVLPLSVAPILLAPIIVEARAYRPWVLEELEQRRRTSFGYFITREQIEERSPLFTTDLLRTVAGVSVVPSSAGALVRLRGGCRPEIVLDGARTIADLPIDDIIRPLEVEAVEVYHGVNAPPQYSNNPCGAVLIWSRRGIPDGNTSGFWKRLAFALSFLALGFLLTRF